ncbi:MAG: glycosyltransferase family 39 protein [Bacillota bacterium]|nr:glycosyltransferase family 39 protein [Bacillota bacterium]
MWKPKASWKDIVGIILLAAGVVMLGVSVFLCFSRDIWYDELFTMGLAGQPLGELISITARDVHPPLYYMIVRLFLLTGEALFGSIDQVVAAKLVSVLPFLLCLVYSITKVKKHFGMLSAGLFSFLLLTMPQMAGYTVEVRMYGYAVLFILAGMLHAYELTDENTVGKKKVCSWAAVTLYALAACYTHYFACVAACMIYVYLLTDAVRRHKVRKMIRPFLVSGVICAAGYLPWLLMVVTAQVAAVKDNYWIMPLSVRTLGGCVKFLFYPAVGNEMLGSMAAVLLFVLYGIAFIFFCVHSFKKEQQKEGQAAMFCIGCVGVLAGIVVFGFATSILIRPIFVYRYMLPAMGVFWLTFAIVISKIEWKRPVCILGLIVLAAVGIRNYRSFYGEEMWKRVQMEQTEAALSQIGQEDLIVCNFDQTQAVVSYYLSNDSYLWYGNPEELIRLMYPANHSLVEGEFDDREGIKRMKELLDTGRRVWFFGSGASRDEIIAKWTDEGIEAEEVGSVMLERYWFNIYRIKNISDIDGRDKKR